MPQAIPSKTRLLVKLLVANIVSTVALGGLLILTAGTWNWPQLWILGIEVTVLNLGVHLWLLNDNPALLAERLGSPRQPNQTSWDKVFMVFAIVGMPVWFAVPALDHRWGWSTVPVWIQVVGAVLIAVSLLSMVLVFRANSFAAPVVKVQAERGHSIVDTGPYAYVRHPMYSGAIPFLVGTPLLLGSWYGLIGSAATVLALGFRAVGEERLLTQELDGYPEYAARVRFRLVPGIW
ncbi:isoprenylcysteine carboxyl methyltransferase [Mycobacteroides stephanolepidis]|uniref:Isoprenylcysteine carboxyl methyltransferase n=1 Tax=[Mycobacterium] stephanolepidis TaxID=1520670 RepID=A0A1Z4EQY3_9MYCO|nr:isoprenylcysteine carboxylmethyltransferase family protein [[Mycobacterium] stephanolepidis]BAX95369.1 isoprenylcysteine carboxyl methyltransferase [[Mycobacterium] stephanolepidis]